jgi:hypothetical protein
LQCDGKSFTPIETEASKARGLDYFLAKAVNYTINKSCRQANGRHPAHELRGVLHQNGGQLEKS